MKKITSALILATAMVSVANADGNTSYRVTITNATANQVITPALLITHRKNFKLFSVGLPASNGLAYQAENGDPSLVYGEVVNAHGVNDVKTGSGVVLPGHSESIDIMASKKSRLTFTAMLASTNDAFAALNAVKLPGYKKTYYAYAHDAGSEMNNENCSYVPGPPCSGDSGNARTENGEGFVSIHNGIHGDSDLNPKKLDWRGPVAIITVERLEE